MRLRSIIREEELKKKKRSPKNFEIISASERRSLGLESCVVSSDVLETARLAKVIRQVLTLFSLLCIMADSPVLLTLSHVSVALVKT